tara:strand:- start:67975 stop:68349 length:375 start_codon:yes stop_codon:yes gene_type:complete
VCKYNNIIKLLGYTDDQIYKIEDNYIEPWFDKGGLKISVLMDDSLRDTPIHFISKEKHTDLMTSNRDISLNNIFKEDKDKEELIIPQWKVGDMCYFEYKINYISDMEDDKITGCKDDFGEHMGI